MIKISDSAKTYFKHLIDQQDMENLGLRIEVRNPGMPTADCQLSFCEEGQNSVSDTLQDCDLFSLYIEKTSASYLEEAEFDYEESPTGGQLVIRAPNIKGRKPTDDAPLEERVQYVITTEINPQIASHGGQITLIGIENGIMAIRFGGGCQGCGMASVTLKQGVEKTILEKFPEITEVRDVTDHAQGENPYYN